MSRDINVRHTPDGRVEDDLRRQVRDALDLSWDARDFQIVAEVQRLKEQAEVLWVTKKFMKNFQGVK